MLSRPLFRFARDDHNIPFLKGGKIGLMTSAVLSLLSICLFFYPGLNLGLDFRGGVVMEIHTPRPETPAEVRAILDKAHIDTASVQTFGSPQDLRIAINLPRGPQQPGQTNQTIDYLRQVVTTSIAGVQIEQADAVGASVSKELLRNGILALVFSLAMIMIYIWIRFEREFALSAVITLVLDLTKTIGFLVITRFEFDAVMIAAILTILGYSTNDKVVVYDRIRENLRKYRKMPLAEVLNLSINETLNRTLATSSTVFLAALPLALFGGSTLTGFATVMLFGIVVGTSSSIFIAAPLLLLLGRKRLRPEVEKRN
ncbi:protein translocase subunit SecF [Oecophyllibacter saccharovorans]|uniref:Protein-export membrane protein SecF n=1 Tax=Oecophyllibacter saccharovorans TaxID=2558360 RepID=A0A506UQH0_9PROT|nr:protein translocase subunit SecF [Oecophyllibacter saccharovorans]QDH15850.1 protein translocase subunit SecF [Oecophyllibacter saccharovorans]TPW35302.1 protein translocase subunit SecF [Oecophyllibacter saccharovorans]TPW35631.1 protein translocase subunit SecF [Oecophyllibacter saccharovorans]